MSRNSEHASFTADKTVLREARAIANETERGNFSAYIEKCLIRGAREAKAAKRREAK